MDHLAAAAAPAPQNASLDRQFEAWLSAKRFTTTTTEPGPAAQSTTRPPLVALVYRVGKGCRQYPMATVAELRAFASRHPYKTETLRVIVALPDGTMGPDRVVDATRAAAFVEAALTAPLLPRTLDDPERSSGCAIAHPNVVYCQVPKRAEFDRLDATATDHGVRMILNPKTWKDDLPRRLLTKRVEGDGVTVVFQHWGVPAEGGVA